MFCDFDVDEMVKVVVLWGCGGCFCVGVDFKVVVFGECLLWYDEIMLMSGDGLMGLSCLCLFKLVIVVVFGYVVVGGFEFVIWCDFCVVEEDVMFGVYC